MKNQTQNLGHSRPNLSIAQIMKDKSPRVLQRKPFCRQNNGTDARKKQKQETLEAGKKGKEVLVQSLVQESQSHLIQLKCISESSVYLTRCSVSPPLHLLPSLICLIFSGLSQVFVLCKPKTFDYMLMYGNSTGENNQLVTQ